MGFRVMNCAGIIIFIVFDHIWVSVIGFWIIIINDFVEIICIFIGW